MIKIRLASKNAGSYYEFLKRVETHNKKNRTHNKKIRTHNKKKTNPQ